MIVYRNVLFARPVQDEMFLFVSQPKPAPRQKSSSPLQLMENEAAAKVNQKFKKKYFFSKHFKPDEMYALYHLNMFKQIDILHVSPWLSNVIMYYNLEIFLLFY